MTTSGRHFLQIPGPSNVPDSVLHAIAMPTIDHRGPEFQELFTHVLDGMAAIFHTKNQVVIYPATGTGAWEAALVNTLDPGDEILCYETGHFSSLWAGMAEKWGLKPTVIAGDWRTGADPEKIREALAADTDHRFKAVCVVHNETSTGVTSRIPEIRRAIDDTGHPALFMVDTISSLGSVDYRHDEWGVDVTVSGSQKGLMLPPGLSFNAVSDKALDAHQRSTAPKSVWNWTDMLEAGANGRTPYTPNTNILYGLRESAATAQRGGPGLRLRPALPLREGDPRRRRRLGARSPLHEPRRVLPRAHRGHHARRLRRRRTAEDHPRPVQYVTRGGPVEARRHRFPDRSPRRPQSLTLAGTLSGVQMGLRLAGVTVDTKGLDAALDILRDG